MTAAGGETAMAAPVDDSSAGTSILIYGDGRGLRLRRLDGDGATLAEPYLLLAAEATSLHVPLWHLAPGLVIAGFGMGLVLSPLAETVLTRVHPAHAAAASGALSTALDEGGAIGVAVIGSVYLSRTGAGAGSGQR